MSDVSLERVTAERVTTNERCMIQPCPIAPDGCTSVGTWEVRMLDGYAVLCDEHFAAVKQEFDKYTMGG